MRRLGQMRAKVGARPGDGRGARGRDGGVAASLRVVPVTRQPGGSRRASLRAVKPKPRQSR